MDKVYVVTEGSYSDYHIVAIFSDKNNADIHAALLNSTESFYDEARVEEWDVDAEALNRYLIEFKKSHSED